MNKNNQLVKADAVKPPLTKSEQVDLLAHRLVQQYKDAVPKYESDMEKSREDNRQVVLDALAPFFGGREALDAVMELASESSPRPSSLGWGHERNKEVGEVSISFTFKIPSAKQRRNLFKKLKSEPSRPAYVDLKQARQAVQKKLKEEQGKRLLPLLEDKTIIKRLDQVLSKLSEPQSK